MAKKTTVSPNSINFSSEAGEGRGDKGKTRIGGDLANSFSETSKSAEAPPVVGWVVVIDGPGKGRSRELTFGMNTIGRASGNRVVLDFGEIIAVYIADDLPASSGG